MSDCLICDHPWQENIETLLKSPHPISRVAMFYGLPIAAVKFHKKYCMQVNR